MFDVAINAIADAKANPTDIARLAAIRTMMGNSSHSDRGPITTPPCQPEEKQTHDRAID